MEILESAVPAGFPPVVTIPVVAPAGPPLDPELVPRDHNDAQVRKILLRDQGCYCALRARFVRWVGEIEERGVGGVGVRDEIPAPWTGHFVLRPGTEH